MAQRLKSLSESTVAPKLTSRTDTTPPVTVTRTQSQLSLMEEVTRPKEPPAFIEERERKWEESDRDIEFLFPQPREKKRTWYFRNSTGDGRRLWKMESDGAIWGFTLPRMRERMKLATRFYRETGGTTLMSIHYAVFCLSWAGIPLQLNAQNRDWVWFDSDPTVHVLPVLDDIKAAIAKVFDDDFAERVLSYRPEVESVDFQRQR